MSIFLCSVSSAFDGFGHNHSEKSCPISSRHPVIRRHKSGGAKQHPRQPNSAGCRQQESPSLVQRDQYLQWITMEVMKRQGKPQHATLAKRATARLAYCWGQHAVNARTFDLTKNHQKSRIMLDLSPSSFDTYLCLWSDFNIREHPVLPTRNSTPIGYATCAANSVTENSWKLYVCMYVCIYVCMYVCMY